MDCHRAIIVPEVVLACGGGCPGFISDLGNKCEKGAGRMPGLPIVSTGHKQKRLRRKLKPFYIRNRAIAANEIHGYRPSFIIGQPPVPIVGASTGGDLQGAAIRMAKGVGSSSMNNSCCCGSASSICVVSGGT